MATRSHNQRRLIESASAGCRNQNSTMKNMTSGIHFDGKVFSYENEKQEQIAKLKEWFPKGSTVYTILRHVSQSGMSRDISVLGLHHEEASGNTFHIHPNFAVSKALGWTLKTKNGHDTIRVGGCGMDMGYHLVNSLSCALYDDGYALKHEWL